MEEKKREERFIENEMGSLQTSSEDKARKMKQGMLNELLPPVEEKLIKKGYKELVYKIHELEHEDPPYGVVLNLFMELFNAVWEENLLDKDAMARGFAMNLNRRIEAKKEEKVAG